jgi:hypothetical protein
VGGGRGYGVGGEMCAKYVHGGTHTTKCVCGDVGREVIRLTYSQSNLIQGQGPYLLLTPYTHGVPHVDCEGPCAVLNTCVDDGIQQQYRTGMQQRAP